MPLNGTGPRTGPLFTGDLGGMAGASVAWGIVAEWVGVQYALLAASAAVVVTLALGNRYRLQDTSTPDLTPSPHWPISHLKEPLAGGKGPVCVTVEYQIDPAKRRLFRNVKQAV